MAFALEFLDTQLPPELRKVLEAQINPPTYSDTTAAPETAPTQNTACGRSVIDSPDSACTVTNSLCTSTSVVIVTLEDIDATLLRVKVVPGAGSFVVTGNTTATADVKFRWYIVGARS